MAWIEGLTSSNRILLDLAKIMTQANKDLSGNTDPARNWEIVYPRPFDLTEITGEALTADAENAALFTVAGGSIYEPVGIIVYETVGETTSTVNGGDYSVDYKTGKITFNRAVNGAITVDYSFAANESLDTAFNKIKGYGNIVLKTKTTPVTPDTSSDPFNTDPDLQAEELEMFLEIEKPQFLINPETGQLATRYEDDKSIENHFHLNMRTFDRYDYAKEAPVEKVIDGVTNLVIDEGAHVSEWSKFSWYKDFKEFLVDELDGDPGTDNLNDGIVFTYIDTPGLYGEMPIQYWISTNNDRLAMVLMGEPSINYDNYLTSFAYAGKIDSFEGGKNDTAGNFALTTGSSTIPCAANPNPNPITEALNVTASVGTDKKGSGNYTATHKVSYKVLAFNEHGISMPTKEMVLTYTFSNNTSSSNNESTDYSNFRLKFDHIPENATGVRIYRKDITVNGGDNKPDQNWLLESELTREEALSATYNGRADQDQKKVCPVNNTNEAEAGVLRDSITGSVTEVRFPTTWGANTATGVNDVSMYKTRSGVYFQRHQASFITPEQFMAKDAFNPSRWTNKFHLSPLYVVHGYDGYRGWLKDVVVVDDSAVVHLDELIVNKGQANEEIYKYFKLSAPFSLMKNSANANYGIGIKKI